MIKPLRLTFFMLLTAFLALPLTSASAQETTLNKEEIEAIIKDYILNNGEVVLDAVEKYQTDQQTAQEQAALENLTKSKDYLHSDEHPYAGAEKPKATIIEFFDYNCGYCKKAYNDIIKILDTDKDIRIVFMELPILGPTSLTAAQWSIAAHKQGKYFEFHKALMKHNGQKSESELTKIAKKLDLDIDQMKKDANSDETKAYILKLSQTSRDLGISGTPAFIAGEEIIRGYIGLEGMRSKIEELKNSK